MVKALTIEDAREAARQRGGECLSNTYVNTMTHLRWRCQYGHEWSACLSKIKNCGRWCPDCGGRKKLTLNVAQELAIFRGGQCLSQEYINCESLLQWRCSKGHVWQASLNNVKNKQSWCPECAGVTKWTIQELDEIAIQNGGRLLSTEYVNSQTHLEWLCAHNHKWSAVPNSIVQGSWCPTCRVPRGERAIIDWLNENNIEYVSQFKFPHSRYSYDFCIPSTKWLIEFDGLQHFRDVPFFTDKKSFEERQEIDRKKTQRAYVEGYSLLRIHYYDINMIPELLKFVTMQAPAHVICSRLPDYAYLNLTPAVKSLEKKPLTLVVQH